MALGEDRVDLRAFHPVNKTGAVRGQVTSSENPKKGILKNAQMKYVDNARVTALLKKCENK